MISADVTFYSVVLFFHIFSIVIAFGPTYFYPVFFAFGEKEPQALPAMGRAVIFWGRWVITGASLLAIVTGVYLTSDRWAFGDFFVSWGMVAIVLLLGLGHGFFIPQTRKANEIAERDIKAAGDGPPTLSAEYEALVARIGNVGKVSGLVILLTVYVMTAKPFL